MKSPLKNLSEWVQETFEKDQLIESQAFNVHAYTQEQKDEAIVLLQAEGFTCSLNNNNNQLFVQP